MEATRLQRDITSAEASNDVGAIIALILNTSELTEDDFVNKTLGHLRFLYYSFLEKFHQRPRDMEDLIDGILYIEDINYIQKRARKRARARTRKEH